MPKTRDTSIIPLQCSLCPKSPQFSDVSHLLTHISSKSHLSHRFKLQIRAQGEPDSRRQLDVFETWYAENGLEDLLSERMATKNQKRIAATTKKKRESSGTSKKETKKQHSLAPNPTWRAPVPRMHLWSTGENSTQSILETSPNDHSPPDGYVTPTMKKKVPNFSRRVTPTRFWDDNIDPTVQKADETDDDFDLDTSKLKGVFWPGMNLFDSATVEMKRMRNQRKDGSVVAQMRSSAGGIEPIEWVFNADGTFRKIRDVYDENPDSTPEKDDEAVALPLKKRRSRKAMSELSTNIPILRQPAPSAGSNKRVTKRTTKRQITTTDLGEYRTAYHQNEMKVDPTSRRYIPSLDEDQEFKLTVGDMGQKRRFGIFRDAREDSPGIQQFPRDQPCLLIAAQGEQKVHSKNENSNSPKGFMPPPDIMNDIHSIRSPLPKPILTMQTGKENSSAQQFDMRGPGTNPSFPPQAFHDQMVNPLLFHHPSHSFSYGESLAFNATTKVPQSSFLGDFKHMMPTSYPTQGGSHAHSVDFDSGRNMNFCM